MDDNLIKENLKKSKMPWYNKLLFRFWPTMAFKLIAKDIKIENVVFDKLHDIFGQTKRIDIFPSISDSRGFILVLDRETALYFYQDGDHFIYDGFEMGEYEKGKVTVFDHLRRNN